MENLITVFIIILIVLVSIGRKIVSTQTKKQDGDPSAATGWAAKLNAFINDIQQRVEAQKSQESSSDADQWRQLMEEEAPGRRYRQTMDDLIMEDEIEMDDHPDQRSSPRRPETEAVPSPQPSSAPAMPPAKVVQRSPLLGSTMSSANLRRAVIWSEILGPPIALRGPDEDRSV